MRFPCLVISFLVPWGVEGDFNISVTKITVGVPCQEREVVFILLWYGGFNADFSILPDTSVTK